MIIETSRCTIQPITDADLEEVLEVYRQCEDFLALCPTPKASMEMVLDDWKLSDSKGGTFCGIRDLIGTMIGVVDFSQRTLQEPPHDPYVYISLLMVSQNHRGQGYAAEVAEGVEAHAKECIGASFAALHVQENNPSGIRFWQKVGYHIVCGPEQQSDGTVTYGFRKTLHRSD